MRYFERQLLAGETLVHQSRIHWSIYARAIVWALAAIASVVMIAVMRRDQGGDIGPLLIVPGGLLLVAAGQAFMAYLRRNSMGIAVTNQRIIIKAGLFSRRLSETMLTQVEGIKIDQSFLGRMLGFGTVIIEGTGSDHSGYAHISQPMQLRRAVLEEIDRKMTPRPAAPDTPAEGDRYDRLLKLESLRASGTLTDQEFQTEKDRILRSS